MTISSFRDENRFLSNFFRLRKPIVHKGITYWYTETFFQASKTLDMKLRLAISKMSPSESKTAGRAVKLRDNWESLKVISMFYALIQKFSDPWFKEKLMATKSHKLIEGNTWGDTYWGVDKRQGGHNMLGLLLMTIRDLNLV